MYSNRNQLISGAFFRDPRAAGESVRVLEVGITRTGSLCERQECGRILYVFLGRIGRPGKGLVAYHEAVSLARCGWEVDLIARGRIDARGVHNTSWPAAVAHLIWLFGGAKTRRALRQRLFGWLAARRLRHGEYAAVVTWSGLGWRIFPEAERRGVSYFLNCANFAAEKDERDPEGFRHWPYVGWDRLRAEYTETNARVLVGSECARQSFLRAGCDDLRLHKIERGFDPSIFFPSPSPSSIKAPPDRPFRLLFCGYLCERKGILLLLEMWREMALKGTELWLCGPVDVALQDRIDELATSSMKFLGPREDVAEVMRQCDAQILLSSNEGQAKALLEGAACGLPTVATRETGFPFHLGDIGHQVDLARLSEVPGILRLLVAEPERRAEMSARAAQLMKEHYSWDNFRSRFISEFERALRE